MLKLVLRKSVWLNLFSRNPISRKPVFLHISRIVCLLAATPAAFAGVSVSAPGNGATVQSPVNFVASASSSCSAGVASMGIYTAPNVLAYTVQGASLNTNLDLAPGTYNTVVEEWDYCGGASTIPIKITVTNASEVQVAAPANNSTVSSPVHFDATASSTCPSGVASMGIYTAAGQLAYVTQGAYLNTNLSLGPGIYNAVVEEWDYCGGAKTTPVTFTVPGSSNEFYGIQAGSGWDGYILLPPSDQICSTCSQNGPQDIWWMAQDVSSPSLSGKSSEFHMGGGNVPYAQTLWNVHLIGDGSAIPDPNQQIVPNLHNFIYDVYFFSTDIGTSQALEFDINQFTNGLSFIWGHECRIMGGNEWDIWDNQTWTWVPTGIPCYPNNNDWNHLTIQVQRTSDNQLLYESITLNGQQYNLNAYYAPTSTSWYGVTVNYQMDGNYAQQPYQVWLDNLNFTYW
jgi:hypothetical protein